MAALLWLASAAGNLGAIEVTHEEQEYPEGDRSFTFRTARGTIEIVQEGVWFPCCLQLEVEAELSEGVLTLREIDNSPPCPCPALPFQVTITIADVPPGTYEVYLLGSQEQILATALLDVPGEHGALFTRGDTDGNGRVILNDAILILGYLFQGMQLSVCLDAADVDDSGRVDIGDPIGLLTYMFAQGPPPQAPYPDPGGDTTPDLIGCTGEVEIVAMDFIRGDANRDGGVNVGDIVFILQFLGANGPRILCLDAADINDDGAVNMADVSLIGIIPPFNWPPWPGFDCTCGPDLTPDRLGCRDRSPSCQ